MSAIGRLGIIGLLLFLALMIAIAASTWHVVRRPDADLTALGLWASVWVILVSACLGVVLEGPMGAVVFWSLLGLASTISTKSGETAEHIPTSKDANGALPVGVPAAQVSRS